MPGNVEVGPRKGTKQGSGSGPEHSDKPLGFILDKLGEADRIMTKSCAGLATGLGHQGRRSRARQDRSLVRAPILPYTQAPTLILLTALFLHRGGL